MAPYLHIVALSMNTFMAHCQQRLISSFDRDRWKAGVRARMILHLYTRTSSYLVYAP